MMSGGVPAPVALLLADLDHFKRINDRHGHPVGDKVLALAASILSAECRNGDVVARYGGEEFAILCPGLDAPRAIAVAERMCGALRDSGVMLPGGERVHLTMSVGVAVALTGEKPECLVARADRALYAAKAAGRDRVIFAPGTDPGLGMAHTTAGPVPASDGVRAEV